MRNEYRKNKPPITSEPPHKNADNHDTFTVRRLPICRNLLFDAPAATRQPTPSHIWHLINIHRAAFALAGRPYPPLPCAVPIDHPLQGAPSRAPLAKRPCLFCYLANRWRRCACSRGRRVADSCTPSEPQVRQDLVDHKRILNTDNDLHWTATSTADTHINACAARPRRSH